MNKNPMLLDHFQYVCQREAVKEQKSFSEKQKEYQNKTLINTIREISQSYQSYREVRGDGNCFYRSIIIYYIETELVKNEINGVQNIQKIPEWIKDNILYKDQIPKKFHIYLNIDYMKTILNQGLQLIIYEKLSWNNIQSLRSISLQMKIRKFMSFLLNHHEFLDFCLVYATRCIIYEHYIKQKENENIKNFLQQSEEQSIKTYGAQAEGIIIYMTVYALNYQLHIVSLENKMNVYEISTKQNFKSYQNIYLFYRKGHYDICYQKSELITNNTATKNKIQPKSSSKMCLRCSNILKETDQSNFCEICCQKLIDDSKSTKTKCKLCSQKNNSFGYICELCLSIFTKQDSKYEMIGKNFQCHECEKQEVYGFRKKLEKNERNELKKYLCINCFKETMISSLKNSKCSIF